jgi:signal transduction histidine kinase
MTSRSVWPSAILAIAILGTLALIQVHNAQVLTGVVCLFGLAGICWLTACARQFDRSLKMRDEVLRVVSHDLLNPLNTVQLAAEMWRMSTLGQPQPFAGIILRSVKRMSLLTQELRDSLLLDSRKQLSLHMGNHLVGPLLQEVYEAAECLASEKNIDVELDIPQPSIPVIADRSRLLQVLFNLVDNAIKFTPKNGRIRVRCCSEGMYLQFSVTDTGPGIRPEHVDKVFNLYWQAAPTAHLGCGLGLATARHIVEQHGGKIWVQSVPGQGTTFFFTIPAPVELSKVA